LARAPKIRKLGVEPAVVGIGVAGEAEGRRIRDARLGLEGLALRSDRGRIVRRQVVARVVDEKSVVANAQARALRRVPEVAAPALDWTIDRGHVGRPGQEIVVVGRARVLRAALAR